MLKRFACIKINFIGNSPIQGINALFYKGCKSDVPRNNIKLNVARLKSLARLVEGIDKTNATVDKILAIARCKFEIMASRNGGDLSVLIYL